MNEIPVVEIKERGDHYIALYFMLACLIALTSNYLTSTYTFRN
jgi:hypothetical protein